MTKAKLNSIITKRRWPVETSDFFGHYIFALIPLMCIGMGASVIYSGLINDDTGLQRFGLLLVILWTLGLLFTIKQLYHGQYFQQHFTKPLENHEIEQALKLAGFFGVKYYKAGYFQCAAKMSGFSWGETITIIPGNELLLINSRPHRQPITIAKDQQNIKKIIKALQAI